MGVITLWLNCKTKCSHPVSLEVAFSAAAFPQSLEEKHGSGMWADSWPQSQSLFYATIFNRKKE